VRRPLVRSSLALQHGTIGPTPSESLKSTPRPTPRPRGIVTVAQDSQISRYRTASDGEKSGAWACSIPSGSRSTMASDQLLRLQPAKRHAHEPTFPNYLSTIPSGWSIPETKVARKRSMPQEVDSTRRLAKWGRCEREDPFFRFYAITLPHGDMNRRPVTLHRQTLVRTRETSAANGHRNRLRPWGALVDLLKKKASPTTH